MLPLKCDRASLQKIAGLYIDRRDPVLPIIGLFTVLCLERSCNSGWLRKVQFLPIL